MITLHPYEDFAAMDVIRNLDADDRREAEALRGAAATHLALWADWRSIEGVRIASWLVRRAATGQPIALVALANTGQAGVAQAAMLARDHRANRRELAALARVMRGEMPRFCNEHGIRRIEARAWMGHPRASAFLAAIGFATECDMAGFGPAGAETFRQFAYVVPQRPQEGRTRGFLSPSATTLPDNQDARQRASQRLTEDMPSRESEPCA